MRFRKIQRDSWWWLGELCEVPRCLLKGTEASLSCVQCFLCLVSSSVKASIFHIAWLDIFWTDLIILDFVCYFLLRALCKTKEEKEILVYSILFVWYFAWFGHQNNTSLIKMSWKLVPFSSRERLVLIILWMFGGVHYWSHLAWLILCRKFLCTNFIFLFAMDLFIFYFFLSFSYLYFPRNLVNLSKLPNLLAFRC